MSNTYFPMLSCRGDRFFAWHSPVTASEPRVHTNFHHRFLPLVSTATMPHRTQKSVAPTPSSLCAVFEVSTASFFPLHHHHHKYQCSTHTTPSTQTSSLLLLLHLCHRKPNTHLHTTHLKFSVIRKLYGWLFKNCLCFSFPRVLSLWLLSS